MRILRPAFLLLAASFAPAGAAQAEPTSSGANPGKRAAGRAADAAQERAKEVFGDKIPDELMKVAIQGADTSHSSEPFLKGLEMAAQANNPKLAEPAKDMLAAFDRHVADRIGEMKKLAADEPAKAWALMETLVKWVPRKGAEIQKQKAEWLRDPVFLKELGADKRWLALEAQAARIGFGKNPKAKPTNQLEADYRKLIQDKALVGTKGVAKAKAAADGWKLDPETGRADKWKPASPPAAARTETKASS